jgi:hypothetical protein
MAMDRYNSPVVRGFFDKFFLLSNSYQSTRRNISELYADAPAGVVTDEMDSNEREKREIALIGSLEENLYSFEKAVPQDIASQRDIAELLSDVRCFVYSE